MHLFIFMNLTAVNTIKLSLRRTLVQLDDEAAGMIRLIAKAQDAKHKSCVSILR